jgi:hypothetical protein
MEDVKVDPRGTRCSDVNWKAMWLLCDNRHVELLGRRVTANFSRNNLGYSRLLNPVQSHVISSHVQLYKPCKE